MFERFTDRARRVVVLAQEEARLLHHAYIGTEHILLGLIREEGGVAAKALASLGIELQAVRDRVAEVCSEGEDEQPSGHIPFTPRAKRVLELSLREALQLGHNYIGTEHILLGLIREGEGVAARVLVELGASLNVTRQRVIGLLHGATGVQIARAERAVRTEGRPVPGRRERTLVAGFRVRLTEIESRLAAIEERVGFGPDVSELDKQIVRLLGEKHAAADAQDYEHAAELRDTERRLAADKAAKQQEWSAAHPGMESLGESVRRLEAEVGVLRQLLSQHGIDPAPADLPEAGQGEA
jgi:Clp amino terminal domain, pathogenicity island component/UvrB/uvrC motif